MRDTFDFYRISFSLLLVAQNLAISQPLSKPGLTVHVFLSTECPISQQYARQLTHLQHQYGPRGVHFVAWFPLRTDSRRAIRHFQHEYGLLFIGKPDVGARLAHQFRVRATPEVVVMQADGRIRYQGAIDDWYVALGKHRPAASQHYVHDALDALLADKDVAITKTDAVGCLVE